MEKKRATASRLGRSEPTPRGKPPTSGSSALTLTLGSDFDARGYVESKVRAIEDFPSPGILFRDITPLLADPKAFHLVLDAITHRFIGERIDAVVGVESRGFIFGGALAARMNASFVPVRKAGKLPFKSDRVSYSLEYGEAEVEMHRDALPSGAHVLVVDDLLATGGTAAAAAELVERQGARVHAFAFVIELEGLGGRERLAGHPVLSVIRYS